MPRAAEPRPRSVLKRARCANCGATDHATRDCLERPRRIPRRPGDAVAVAPPPAPPDDLPVVPDIAQEQDAADFLVADDEAQLVEDAVQQRRMAVKNLRSREDIAPYLRDLEDGDCKVEREVQDMETVWEPERPADDASESLVFERG